MFFKSQICLLNLPHFKKKNSYKFRIAIKTYLCKMQKWIKTSARILSYVFHPINIPIFGLIILYNVDTLPKSFLKIDSLFHINYELKKMLLLLFVLFTWIGPLVMILGLKRSGAIDSLQMHLREERNAPIVFMMVFYLVFFGLMKFQIPQGIVPRFIESIILGAAVGLFCARLANNQMKISLHTLGLGMLSGSFYAYLLSQALYPLWLLPAVFLLSGIVASARIVMGSHNHKELLWGFSLGFLAQFITAWLYI